MGNRLVVTGGRDFSDVDHVYSTLDGLHARFDIYCLIHGGAPGVDKMARDWAISRGIALEEFKAKWDSLYLQPSLIKTTRSGSKYNAYAGFIRNEEMITEGKPDIAAIFPGGPGTQDMSLRLDLHDIQVVHRQDPILEFQGKYRFLSNFFRAGTFFEGRTYVTSENAYQAAKVLAEDERVPFTLCTPVQAKKLGKFCGLRNDWEFVKLDVMKTILRSKFTNEGVKKRLLRTGRRELVEGNVWGDRFWGKTLGTGKNWLGILLMEVRGEILSSLTTDQRYELLNVLRPIKPVPPETPPV